MATEHTLQLKAQLDTSEVQQKLQQLGQVGTASTGQLEDAVKRLDQSIKQLSESWKKAAQEQSRAMQQQQSHQRIGGVLIKGAGVHIVGNLLAQGERYFTATGNTTAANATGYGSAMLRGAGIGAAVGSVVPGVGTVGGAVFGAALGAAEKALDNLAKSAEKAAQKLEEGIKAEERSRKHFDNEMLRRNIEGVQFNSTGDLKERREFLMQDIIDYRHAAAEGKYNSTAEGQILYAQQLDYMKEQADIAQKEIDAIDAELKARGEWYDSAVEIAQLQQEEAEAIKQRIQEEKKLAAEFEARRQQEEQTTKAASDFLASMTQQQSARQFSQSLQDMTPAQLVSMVDELKKARDELEAKAMSTAAEAMDSSDLSKLTDAQNYYEQQKTAEDRLREAEAVLNGIAVKRDSKSLASLASLLGDTTSSEAAKGYDTGGYAKLEDAVWKAQLEQQRKIEVNTQKTANDLSEVKNAVLQLRNMRENSNGTSWS